MELVFPTIEHKQAAWDYRQEYIDYGESHIHGSSSFTKADDYESWLKKITWNKTEATPDWVTGSVYFAVVDGKIIGTIAVRHYLNDSLLKSAVISVTESAHRNAAKDIAQMFAFVNSF